VSHHLPKGECTLAKETDNPSATRSRGLSVDGWAVAVALALALLIRLGLIHKVPW
jgi:hypothetical protein